MKKNLCSCGTGRACTLHDLFPKGHPDRPKATTEGHLEDPDAEARKILDKQKAGADLRTAAKTVFSMSTEELGMNALHNARAQDCPNCRPGDPCIDHAAGSI